MSVKKHSAPKICHKNNNEKLVSNSVSYSMQ